MHHVIRITTNGVVLSKKPSHQKISGYDAHTHPTDGVCQDASEIHISQAIHSQVSGQVWMAGQVQPRQQRGLDLLHERVQVQ